jgi:citrate lyase beta subunit
VTSVTSAIGFFKALDNANAAHARRFPGDRTDRQPVHTVYGGAHLFKSDTAARLAGAALKTLHDYAPDPISLATALELRVPDGASPETYADRVFRRVVQKLQEEAVEDFRIDFEDGYGHRPDPEEDGHAAAAAAEVAKGLKNGTLPPFIGIRIKPLSSELRTRSLRTLELFVAALSKAAGGELPAVFLVTLTKITAPEQVATLSRALTALEKAHRLKPGSLLIELMVETPQSIFDAEGRAALPGLVAAASGRCFGAHFGTYDFTASMNITAAYQAMQHSACTFAKHVMQVSLAGTPVFLSDGATNIMPVGDRPTVHAAWRSHFSDVRNSLRQGFYQGWDLHPAQLVPRYAAVFSFFLEGFTPASERLKNFLDKAGKATLVGDVFDDAATGQGLLNFFLRALNCGAIEERDAEAAGLSVEELRTRSFVKILKGRRGSPVSAFE